jgi:hypothetical protein
VEYGLVLRFIIGTSTDPAQEAALQREQQHFGDILRLPLQVCVAGVVVHAVWAAVCLTVRHQPH